MKSKHIRLIAVSEEFLATALFSTRPGERPLDYTIQGLPVGWTLERVWHEPHRRSFMMLIEHPDFSEVPDGAEIPVLTGVAQFVERHTAGGALYVGISQVNFCEFLGS